MSISCDTRTYGTKMCKKLIKKYLMQGNTINNNDINTTEGPDVFCRSLSNSH